MSTIKFSVHRNPKNTPEAADTYHVRPDSYYTIGRDEIVKQLGERHLSPAIAQPLLRELPSVIVENLLDNKAVHLQGLGTFALRLGFRTRQDDAQEAKPAFTDPEEITGNEVQIDGIFFKPDKDFLQLMTNHEVHFENATGRGQVGHTAQYTEEQVRRRVRDYLSGHDYLTRRVLMQLLQLTKHTAHKWLERLTTAPHALLRGEKVGTTFVYRLKQENQ